MKTINVRELRSEVPNLPQTLARERELVLISNGEPIARILPPDPEPPRLRRLDWLRAMARAQDDSTALIRAERDRRGT